MGRANESEIEIDGKISKTLIDSGAMISMMSKEYCDEHEYEIQPLDQLVAIEGIGWADVPYLATLKLEYAFQGLIPLTKMFSCLLVTLLLASIKGYQSKCVVK